MRTSKLFIFIAILMFSGCLPTKTPPVENLSQTKDPSPVTDERVSKLIKIKDPLAPFFKPMGKPQESDWLASFQEAGQTFEEYVVGRPTLPTADRQTIYIQPMGDFTASQRKIMELTAEYMKAFYKLPVKLNPVVKLSNVPPDMQRKNPSEGQKQLRSGYFLDVVLPEMLPADAAAFICFTNFDLYPDESWNYVFGQANLQTRVGVWSLWRFGDPDKSAGEYKMFLERTLKVAMHETGHMFSMLHCTKYVCLMSGSNHLGEADRRPLDVCPECMAKIAWGLDYQPAARYRALAEFWQRQNRPEEAKNFIAKAEAVEQAAR